MSPIRVLLVVVCLTTPARAEQFTASIIAVLDGDTVMAVRKHERPMKIRLAEIDAPEMTQPGGLDAKKSLSEIVLHKAATVDSEALDQYGRLIAHLTVDGRQVNEVMVSLGMAWEYSHFHHNRRYIALQTEAQQAHRGIWRQQAPLPPWQWRKLHAENTHEPATRIRAQESSSAAEYICGNKRRCTLMASCDEAYFHFVHCHVTTLDANNDGVPCDRLCSRN